MFAIEDDPVWLYAAWEFAFEDDERDNQEYSDDASNLLAGRFSGHHCKNSVIVLNMIPPAVAIPKNTDQISMNLSMPHSFAFVQP